jgi:hypothetical protein
MLHKLLPLFLLFYMSITVAAMFKEWIYGGLHAGDAGSNPAGGMDVCLL